jgi:long-chain acyl-CoA synthetase
MKESIYIEQMMVVGANRKFVAALIVPAFMHIRKHLRDTNPALSIPDNNNDLIKLPEVMAQIQKQIDKYNEFFSHPEQVKKVALLPDEWTIDGGELTPSMKIRRKIIEQKYNAQIEALYTE